MRHYARALLLGLGCAGTASVALAQAVETSESAAPHRSEPGKPSETRAASANKPARHKFDPYQSPLATIMQSHLRADVPEARDFVRESRPKAKDLAYTPLQSQLGPDPVRPKPRDAANVLALQAEMEASIAHNAARTGGHGKAKPRHAKADAAN